MVVRSSRLTIRRERIDPIERFKRSITAARHATKSRPTKTHAPHQPDPARVVRPLRQSPAVTTGLFGTHKSPAAGIGASCPFSFHLSARSAPSFRTAQHFLEPGNVGVRLIRVAPPRMTGPLGTGCNTGAGLQAGRPSAGCARLTTAPGMSQEDRTERTGT